MRPNRTVSPPRFRRLLSRLSLRGLLIGAVTIVLLTGVTLLWRAPGGKPAANSVVTSVPAVPTPPVSAEVSRLRSKNTALQERIRALAPTGDFLVIDTAGNKVTLRHGESIRAEMVASCGSGNTLEDKASGRRWVFDTPRGQFRIQSKLTNPIWMKPDWAFIEEGEAIPKNSAARAEAGMMGDYALGIGQGYFIHGTLYTRMLGRNVSHGCVRLGASDLERLYRTLPIGARVIIF